MKTFLREWWILFAGFVLVWSLIWVTPASDLTSLSLYEDGKIISGCKLSYLGLKSVCYDSSNLFDLTERVTVKYPFFVYHEYVFRDQILVKYTYHRLSLFQYINERWILDKKFPNAKNLLIESKELFH